MKAKTQAKETGKVKAVVSESKKKTVQEIITLANKYSTMMIVSIESLASSQLQKLKSLLSDKATIRVTKKSLALMALEKLNENKKQINELGNEVGNNFALLFSNEDPFELAAILGENKNNVFAKSGQIAKEDIVLEKGVTDLIAGPLLSEFGKIKVKAGIEQGKIAIKERAVIIKKGEKISDDVANILAQMEIRPVSVFLQPLGAYDSKSNKFYRTIKVDRQEVLSNVALASTQAFSLALNLGYPAKETIKFLIIKANSEFNALQNKLNSQVQVKTQEPVQENKTPEPAQAQ